MLSIKENVSLAQFTTFQIGGPAKYFCKAKSLKDIKETISWAKKENLPFIMLGGGSNLLISDEGFLGLIIKNELQGIKKIGQTLIAQSGTRLGELVSFSLQNGLSGMQNLAGIPGTVGGAIFGNAGAYGQTISDYLTKVTCLDPTKNQILTLTKEQCQFDYRDSVFKRNNLLILAAHFQLLPKNPQALKKEFQEILSQRISKYQANLKCPGSFFKNIPLSKIPPKSLKLIPKDKITHDKVPAAALLDIVGAKGQRAGNIQVFQNHANLIINTGNGQASDVYQLAKILTQKVRKKFGVTLEPEVQLINLPLLS